MVTFHARPIHSCECSVCQQKRRGSGGARTSGNQSRRLAVARRTDAKASPVCSLRKSGGAVSCRWHASPDCIVTPSPKGKGSCGKSGVCRPIVSAAPGLGANIWRKHARGADGLAGTFAGCHGRRSDHRHEMDSSLAAKTLQGLASSEREVVSHDTRPIVAASAFLAANLSQAKSRHPQPGSRSAISLPAPAAELVFGSKLAGN